MIGTVVAVCTADRKGPKHAVDTIVLRQGQGIDGDAHAGTWHRQVSLLALERIEEMRRKIPDLPIGAFGENVVTRGVVDGALSLGRRVRIGADAVIQITQLGKECHERCRIYQQVGDCIMPGHGVFARVVRTGAVRAGDIITEDPAWERYRFAVVTVSDRSAAGTREDRSGPVAARIIAAAVPSVEVAREVVPDDRAKIAACLVRLCDEEGCDLVVTSGGTGLSPRDVTPEATAVVIDREIPGIADAIRAAGLARTPHAMLSRAICGQRGRAIIVNLSGSPRAVEEQLEVLVPVLPHALEVATGIPLDCAARRG
jgi:molybdenum cofactor synthesis domain-containing protein